MPRRSDGIADAAERRERGLAVGLASESPQFRNPEVRPVQHIEDLDTDVEHRALAERCQGHGFVVWDWGDAWASASATRTVDSHVKALRSKVGASRIRTVHGVGYALEDLA